MLSRREYWLESKCPRCHSDTETCEHVIKCPSANCRTILHPSLTELYAWMTTTNTVPILKNEIERITTYWIDHDVATTITPPCPAITPQISLGWSHFIFGRVHHDITTLQDAQYLSIGSKRDSRSWTAQLIQRLWTKIIRPLWNQRNVTVHGSTNQPSRSRLLADMRDEIRELFTSTNVEDLLFHDRHLLDGPLDVLLSSTLPQLTAWCNSIELVLQLAHQSFQNPNDPTQTHLPGTTQLPTTQPTSALPSRRALTHTSHPLLTPVQLRIARRRHRESKACVAATPKPVIPQLNQQQPTPAPPPPNQNTAQRRRRRPRLKIRLTPRVEPSVMNSTDESPPPHHSPPSPSLTPARRRSPHLQLQQLSSSTSPAAPHTDRQSVPDLILTTSIQRRQALVMGSWRPP